MGSAHVYSFAYMGTAARLYLEHAENAIESQFYNSMSAILYSAFTIEGYLNHRGDKEFKHWSYIERKLSPREKLVMIHDQIGVTVEFGREPLQSFTLAFRIRNCVAHAKTEELDMPDVPPSRDSTVATPDADWEALCTLETARRIVDQSHALVRTMHQQTGDRSDPFAVTKAGFR
tara:strand:+ start:1854 stop:2378 length:525 start_codon:yes stop_codon:yes gene_type:complete